MWIDTSSNDNTPEDSETLNENATDAQPEQSSPDEAVTPEQNTKRQYPTRERRPPDRLQMN